jgi:hypothetical protein
MGKKVGRPAGFSHTAEFKKLLSEKFAGEGNPFYGEKHDEETITRMSKNHADFSGDKNPFKRACKDEKFRKKISTLRKKIWEDKSDEDKKRIAEKLSISMANSKQHYTNKKHKSGFFTTKKGKVFYYRSSWENEVCKDLDSCALVNDFSLEPFVINYTQKDGKKRHSRIDFFVEFINGDKAIVEIKPSGLIEFCPDKIQGYKDYCKNNAIQFFLMGTPFFKSLNKGNRDVVWEELNAGKHYIIN